MRHSIFWPILALAVHSSPVNAQLSPFGPPIAVATAQPDGRMVHLADLDQDGFEDLVIGGLSPDGIGWYRNLNGIGFGSFVPIESGDVNIGGFYPIVTDDLDGDGDLDVVTTRFDFSSFPFSQQVAWYRNLGAGTFSGPSLLDFSLTGVAGPSDVATADLDSDGDVDVLAAFYLSNSPPSGELRWYRNDGTGTFLKVTVTGTQPMGRIAVYDYDGDSDPDVVGTSFPEDRILVHQNAGAGVLAPAVQLGPSINGVDALSPSDLDQDGDLDLVVAAFGPTVGWIENIGGGTYSGLLTIDPGSAVGVDRIIRVGDFDGDGDEDVVTTYRSPNEIRWYENEGGASFSAAVTIDAVPSLITIDVGDLDLDGIDELVMASNPSTGSLVSRYENVEGPVFAGGLFLKGEAGGAGPTYVDAGDVDSDGDQDVVFASRDNDDLGWFENDGLGGFSPPKSIAGTADEPQAVDLADIDGDGRLDFLVASRQDDKVAWYRSIPGGFGAPSTIATIADAMEVKAADLDGDGDQDVIAASFNPSNVYWIENLGAGAFGASNQIAFGSNTLHVDLADLDGDGDVDVAIAGSVFAAPQFSVISWIENLGAGLFAAPVGVESAANCNCEVDARDVDGDGHVDLVGTVQGVDGGFEPTTAWYANDGTGQFASRQLIAGPGPGIVAFDVEAEDLTMDGRPDVLLAPLVPIWHRAAGGETYSSALPIPTAATAFSVQATDFDGDGAIDLVWGTSSGGIFWNLNLLPDRDCNANGTPDALELFSGVGFDCNANGIPDDCDIATGWSMDCDLDGVPDECQLQGNDCNNNGVLDACEFADDCDGDGQFDICELIAGTEADCNNNAILDKCEIASGAVSDCNLNGVPDLCEIQSGAEADCNANGVLDSCELAVGAAFDCNLNGQLDACDIATGLSDDCNFNGVPDECDIALGVLQDCDEDGIPDECEVGIIDCNLNGIEDLCDIASGFSSDCNANGVPDECEIAAGAEFDCNGNGVPDSCELAAGTEFDCNLNGQLDVCDIAAGLSDDCNSNGVPDECDIATGAVQDCDDDGIPDECEVGIVDCNLNGIEDSCDIDSGFSLDCNLNGIPDECDIAGGVSLDCNGNGVPDECDLAVGTSLDCNLNGAPDECDIALGVELDCNLDGIPDSCQIADGSVLDCNGNGVPDSCDLVQGVGVDCNLNGVLDECEFPDGTPTDCLVPTIALVEVVSGGVPLAPEQILTDVLAPGVPSSPSVQISGWALPVAVFGGQTLGVEYRSKFHTVGFAISSTSGGVSASTPLPAFPPGPTDEDSISIDVAITLDGQDVAVLEDAFDYQVFEVAVAPSSAASIQVAIDAANPGTRIKLQPFSSYTGGALVIANKSKLSIIGDLGDPSSVEIRGIQSAPVLSISGAVVDGTVSVAGVQLRDGSTGVAISSSATPWIVDALIEGNSSPSTVAGGVDITSGAAPLLKNVRVGTNASAGSGAGIRVDGASLELYDSLVTDNIAAGSGGGLAVLNTSVDARVRVFNTDFLCNVADGGLGGGLYLGTGARARIWGSSFETNLALLGGGGVALEDVLDVAVAGNEILFNNDPISSASSCGVFWPEIARTEGGGIYVDADTLPLIEGNLVRGNRASVGGGLFVADFANPRIARNWVVCNVASPSQVDTTTSYFGPGVFVEGSSLGDSAQPDILNNTIVDNRVVDGSGLPQSLLGSAIDGGLLGQGAPQITNNLLLDYVSNDCPVPVTGPQGFVLHLLDNRFADVRANSLFGGLETSLGVDCDGNVVTVGDLLCPTCCPLSGLVLANQYLDPLVDPDVVAEVTFGSPAFQSGLPSDPKLPPDLYNGVIPVSKGFVERDGILATGVFVSNPVEVAREAGADAAVSIEGLGATVTAGTTIDVDDQVLTALSFDDDVLVGTFGVRFNFTNAFGAPSGAPGTVRLELPLRPPLNLRSQMALYELDPGTSKFVDTGWRSDLNDLDDRTAIFENVLTISSPLTPPDPSQTKVDLSRTLVGVIRLPASEGDDCGTTLYGLGLTPTVNTIELGAGGGTSVGSTFTAVSANVSGFGPVITALGFAEFSLPLFGGTLLISPVGFQSQAATFAGTDPQTGKNIFQASFPLPPDPSLAFVDLYLQSFAFNTFFPQGWELSNGLELTICP